MEQTTSDLKENKNKQKISHQNNYISPCFNTTCTAFIDFCFQQGTVDKNTTFLFCVSLNSTSDKPSREQCSQLVQI